MLLCHLGCYLCRKMEREKGRKKETILSPSPPLYLLLSLALQPPLKNPREPLGRREKLRWPTSVTAKIFNKHHNKNLLQNIKLKLRQQLRFDNNILKSVTTKASERHGKSLQTPTTKVCNRRGRSLSTSTTKVCNRPGKNLKTPTTNCKDFTRGGNEFRGGSNSTRFQYFSNS